MKRSIGVGDILIGVGLLLMLVFLVIGFATNSGRAAPGGMSALFGGMGGMSGAKWQFGWASVTSIILWFVMIGGGLLLFLSLMKGDLKILNIHYALAGFMILLHLPINVTSYAGIGGPLSFYIFLGALLVGIGTYMATTGMDFLKLGGEKKKAEK
ncbi:MAG: hypothetical protein DRP79_09970 [Planctomycetota bacterium]|nr:MAG: hypothetical protein DRP79_09970 [Planctomycetota bacterium]